MLAIAISITLAGKSNLAIGLVIGGVLLLRALFIRVFSNSDR